MEYLLPQIIALIMIGAIYTGVVCIIKKIGSKARLNDASKTVLKETLISRWFVNILFLVGTWISFKVFVYFSNPTLSEEAREYSIINGLSMLIPLISTHIMHNFMVNLIKLTSVKAMTVRPII